MSHAQVVAALREESSLLETLKRAAEAYDGVKNTPLCSSWVTDLQAIKDTNDALAELSEAKLRKALEQEAAQLHAFLECEMPPGLLTDWWKAFLQDELDHAKALIERLPRPPS